MLHGNLVILEVLYKAKFDFEKKKIVFLSSAVWVYRKIIHKEKKRV